MVSASSTDVTVADQWLGNVTLTATSLDPGASATGTLQYTVLASDESKTLINTAVASGDTPLGSKVSQQRSVVVLVPVRTYYLYLSFISK